MSIRNKLTLRFAGIFALLLILFSLTVYYFTSDYRQREFFDSTRERALVAAHLMLEADEVSEARHEQDLRLFYRTLPEEIVRIYTEDGKLFFDEGKGDLLITPEFIEKVKREKQVEEEQDNRQVVGIYYPDNQGNFIVVASDIDRFSLRKLRNLKNIMIVGFFASMLVVLVAGWFFSKSVLQPITKIVSEVEKISALDLHLRLTGAEGHDELSQLANTFNKMLDRLETSFEMQSTFVSSASHELRTPLTAMIGELEVALMQKREPEEYQRVLASTLDDARMLARLSNGLLQIAQASTDVSTIKLKPLRFDELILSAQQEAKKRQPEIKFEVNFEAYPEDEEALILNGNESLLMVAFLNVFENAGKFSRKGQTVSASIGIAKKGFTVLVKDRGIGIQPNDLVNVFVPFFRAQNVRDISGHGIGLPLAERIIKLHQGTIQVNSKIGEGTEVFVYLPARRTF
ncbi:HAMP domain-containing sensor histidine kinase [Adhaeribacter terreus]|uniref:histidine kinase n=1 Tax=Adhaeribacter terreus TaxID=529703 RepID=A0ABW0E618_9BACT